MKALRLNPHTPLLALLVMVGIPPGLQAQTPHADSNTGHILVRGKSIEVNTADFYTDLERIPKEKQAEFLNSPDRVERLLARLAQIKTMHHAAIKAGVDKEPAIQARLNAVMAKELANVYVERLFNAISVPNLEPRARELYELNKKAYFEEETVEVAHILVDTKKRSKEEAKQRAQMIRAKLDSPEANFEKIALEYSDDPSVKLNKGNLGSQNRRAFVKPFSDAAFAMKLPGEISQPVETEFGFHLIRLKEHRPSRTRPFEEMRTALLNDAEREYRGAELRRQIESLEAEQAARFEPEGIAKVLPKIDVSEILNRAHQASKKVAPETPKPTSKMN